MSTPLSALPSFAQRHAKLLKKVEDAKRRIEAAKQLGQAPSSIGDGLVQQSEPTVQSSPISSDGTVSLPASEGMLPDDPFGDSRYEGYPEDAESPPASEPSAEPSFDTSVSASRPSEIKAPPMQGSRRPIFTTPAAASKKQPSQFGGRPGVGRPSTSCVDSVQSNDEAPPFFDYGEINDVDSPTAVVANKPGIQARRPDFASSLSKHENRKQIKQDMSLDPIWEDDHLPPGSGYTAQEWADARGENNEFNVIEFVAGKERALIRFPTAQKTVAVTKVDPSRGVPVKFYVAPVVSPPVAFSVIVGECFDGCIVLGPRGQTDFPNHVRHGAIVVKDPLRDLNQAVRSGHDFVYGVIEPRVMRNPYGRGAVLNLGEGYSLLGDEPVAEAEINDDDVQDRLYERGG